MTTLPQLWTDTTRQTILFLLRRQRTASDGRRHNAEFAPKDRRGRDEITVNRKPCSAWVPETGGHLVDRTKELTVNVIIIKYVKNSNNVTIVIL